MDSAHDAGLQLSGNRDEMYAYFGEGPERHTLAKFIERDVDALRNKAYEKAIDDARRRAGHIAKLAGGKTGRVLNVIDLSDKNGNALRSNRFGPIGLKVELSVTFELSD